MTRVWHLYRLYDRGGRLLYIGQTGRTPATRMAEHQARRWWAGQIATRVVDPYPYRTLDTVLRAERVAIRRERPLYNDQHNHANPHRVVVVSRPPTRVVRCRRARVSPMRSWLGVVLAGWLLLTVALFAVGVRNAPARDAGLASVTVSTVLVGAGVARPRHRRRR